MTLAWLTDTVTSDLDRALHYTLLWGLEGVELRTVGGPDDRVPFVNEARLKRRLAEEDLHVVAIVPGLFEGNVADRAVWLNELVQLEETMAFCRRMGCPVVVASSFTSGGIGAVEALREAGATAQRWGTVIAVLNETGMNCETGESLAILLEAVDHPAVCAAWNPAATVQAGEAARNGLEALRGRVAHVRCADGVETEDGWRPSTLGEGIVGWPAHLHTLQAQGYKGALSLDINLAPRPSHGLRMATFLVELRRVASRG